MSSLGVGFYPGRAIESEGQRSLNSSKQITLIILKMFDYGRYKVKLSDTLGHEIKEVQETVEHGS